MRRTAFSLLLLATAATAACTASPVESEPATGITREALSDSHTFVQVGTGADATCAVSDEHALWCFGQNPDGELGDGTQTDHDAPERIGKKDWASASLGYEHSCALKVDGSIWCWGDNGLGQAGSGQVVNRYLTPNKVPSDQPWTALAAGGYQTCGIKQDQTLWCWGSNGVGQIGYPVHEPQRSPVQIGIGTSWLDVKSGENFTCALSTSHALTCWGEDTNGQLGDNGAGGASGTSTLAGPYDSFFLGEGHACALKPDGILECWGRNDYGQVGDGTQTNVLVPKRIGKHWSALLQGGGYDSCARGRHGRAKCWGKNVDGEVGVGSPDGFVPTPTKLPNALTWDAVSENVNEGAGIDADGRLYRWGVTAAGNVDAPESAF